MTNKKEEKQQPEIEVSNTVFPKKTRVFCGSGVNNLNAARCYFLYTSTL